MDPIAATLAILLAITLGVFAAYATTRPDTEIHIRHVLTPPDDPGDWGHDVYIATVAYQPSGRRQTLVLVDTNSDTTIGSHTDGPTPTRLKAYVEDVVDDATVHNIQHVQAYQINPDIDIDDSATASR
jgi:hypothetical protein